LKTLLYGEKATLLKSPDRGGRDFRRQKGPGVKLRWEGGSLLKFRGGVL